MAGYSIYIYHLTASEAEPTRAKLDLPPLDQGEMEQGDCAILGKLA